MIRAVFAGGKAPIAAEDSRLALLHCYAEIPTITANEVFNVPDGATFVWNGGTVTVPAGQYSFDGPDVTTSFVKAVQASAGLAGDIWNDNPALPGEEIIYEVRDGKSVFTLKAVDFDIQVFNDTAEYQVIDGAPTLTATGDFTGNGALCTIESFKSVPNAVFAFQWTNASAAGVGVANDYEVGIGAAGSIFHGLAVVNGSYHSIRAGVTEDLTLPYTNGDVLLVYRFFDTLRLSIKDNLGASKYADTYTITLQQWIDNFGATVGGNGSVFVVSTPAGSTQAITGTEGTLIDNSSTLTNYQLRLTFPADSVLEKYLGFPAQGPYTDTGAPAVITSLNDMEGDNKFPPIELILVGQQLDTYSGDISDRDVRSVIYTITDTRSPRGILNPSIHNIQKLDLRNVNQRMSNISCFFRLPTGDKQPLIFTGSPLVVLGLYGPGE